MKEPPSELHTYSLKDCFWRENELTGMGLREDDFKFKASESSSVDRALSESGEFVFSKRSLCTPFCVGVLDERSIQKNGLFAAASSSGSALDVESDLVDVSVTTDTGGSTITPAARLNLWGFKPSYGRISRHGMVPLCSVLDTVGLISREFPLIEKAFSVLDHEDPRDPTSLESGLRDSGVVSGEVRIACNLFNSKDLEVVRVIFPEGKLEQFHLSEKLTEGAYSYVMCPDFFSNMARFDGVNHKRRGSTLVSDYRMRDIIKRRDTLLSPEIRSRILLGGHLLRTSYSMKPYEVFCEKVKALLGDHIWVFPVAKDLRNNRLSRTSWCVINNLLKRPSVTFPTRTEGGVQVSSPHNSDLYLLDFIRNRIR